MFQIILVLLILTGEPVLALAQGGSPFGPQCRKTLSVKPGKNTSLADQIFYWDVDKASRVDHFLNPNQPVNKSKGYLARKIIEEELFQDPENVYWLRRMGDVHIYLDKPKVAIRHYEEALRLSKEFDPELRVALANANLLAGRTRQAMFSVEWVLLEDPQNLGALRMKVKVLTAQWKYVEAKKINDEILETHPEDPFGIKAKPFLEEKVGLEAFLRLASNEFYVGQRFESALRIVDWIMQNGFLGPKLLNFKVEILMALGNIQEATELNARIREQWPDNHRAERYVDKIKIRQVEVLIDQGQLQVALKLINDISDLDKSAATLSLTELILRKMGRIHAADRLLQYIRSKHPKYTPMARTGFKTGAY